VSLSVEPATAAAVPSILGLAAEVEHWFGPMVDNRTDRKVALGRSSA